MKINEIIMLNEFNIAGFSSKSKFRQYEYNKYHILFKLFKKMSSLYVKMITQLFSNILLLILPVSMWDTFTLITWLSSQCQCLWTSETNSGSYFTCSLQMITLLD